MEKQCYQLLFIQFFCQFGIRSPYIALTATIRLSLRASGKTPARKIKYDWKKLVQDVELQERYTIKVRNRFSVLRKTCEDNPTDVYECFMKANSEATEELVPRAPKRPKDVIWNDSRIVEARKVVQNAQLIDNLESSSTSRTNLMAKRNLLSDTYDKLNGDILKSKIKQVENAHINCQHKAAWDLINEVSGRKTAKKGQIKGETQAERLDTWYTHFKQLLGNPQLLLSRMKSLTQYFKNLI